ncbi:MAG TPA: serine hydrolase domain-containing protein [Candidatus Limiplasma sp.]|nr:serine hydrolase domain-containing protein [Candidatus Limiplasma sp.]
MRRMLTLVLCALLVLLPLYASGLTEDELNRQVDESFRKSYTKGGALVLLSGGQIVYERYYGYQDDAHQIPVTQSTYFRIASVTKMVTGIGLMRLNEQGLVSLDADISDYFGFAIANTKYPDTPITLRQIMSHTSSIRGELPGSTRTVSDTLARDARKHAYYTDAKPGTEYTYSNFGAGITGAVIEAVTGQSVNQFMRETVFAPLAIDASYSPGLLSSPDDVAALYNADGSLYRSARSVLADTYEDFPNPDTHYRTTIGSLWIRASDLAKLTIALCGDGTVDGVRVLSQESLAQMRANQADLGLSVTGESKYGLFLNREESLVDGHTFYGHQGMVAGVLCNVYFEPETGFGVVMLTNGCKNIQDHYVGVLARRLVTITYTSFAENRDFAEHLAQTGI